MLAVLIALWLAIAPIHAQEAPPDPAADEADQEAAAKYRLGLDLVGQGKYAEACGLFQRVIDTHPSSPYAAKAEEQMAMAAMAEGGAACGGAPPPAAVGGLGPRSAARDGNGFVELMVSQGLLGPALIGGGVSASLGIESPSVILSLGVVGLTAGIGVPILINSNWDIGQGQAMLVFSGEYIGGLNGGLIADLADTSDIQGVAALITGGAVLGGAAGTAYGIAMKPRAGQVALFRSGFSWGVYFAAASFLLEPEGPVFLRLMSAGDLGAVAGAILATQIEMSRVRVNVINLSGYAGALGLSLLYGIVVAAGVEDTNAIQYGFYTTLTLGAVAGLAVGVVVSKSFDGGDGSTSVGTLIDLENDRWALGTPLPLPRLVEDGTWGVDVTLARGRF